MDYTNWKLLKSELKTHLEEYSNVAQWCNEIKEYHIEEQNIYYAVVKNTEPTEEELQKQVKQVCSTYINNISWRVERYKTQEELGVETTDTTETYLKILAYMQYLREYDEQTGEWWLQNPQTFEEWRVFNVSK